jgi:hypothetical protein
MRGDTSALQREGYAVQNEAARYGERIASLEARFIELVGRLDHLDECLDSAKTHAASNFQTITEKLAAWDTRWKIGLGIIVGMLIVSGGGVVSLKSIIELIGKIAK